ncbi:MAG: hypothetical protein COW30_03295 [Rhodospirillales bacterium CG15_BIG_FIL_POST_REV_8_21_14_020_66_15]|nr:MAG: hypothetical protein COW30_03295 [Rhodospirillales bacterium CG15_BIG_FIL_POST_REV_8_21_14_020_66_15]
MEEVFKPYLNTDEELVWVDQPSPGALAQQYMSESFHGLFGCLFMLAITSMLWAQPTVNAAAFYLVAAAVTWGWGYSLVKLLKPFWHFFMARYLVYGISDQRLIIARTFPSKRFTSYFPSDLEPTETLDRGNDIGDVTFQKEQWKGNTRKPQFRKVGFFGIKDFHKVASAIDYLKS